MTITTQKKLSWTQRVSLVRHNLHAASRSGDFGFFKALQASAFIEGSDYVGTLNAMLGDDADTVQSTLDNLNAGMAYVHQDAFKSVYDAVKRTAIEDGASSNERRASLHVDALQQKSLADNAIDRMTNSAITLIQSQPPSAQEMVANVWISGNTIVADVIEVCLQNIAIAERCGDDFIRLEDASCVVTTAVEAGISALKGIFSLLEPETPMNASNAVPSRSMDWGAKTVLRRLSTALTPLPAGAPRNSPVNSRNSSVASNLSAPPISSAKELRASCSAAVPRTLPPPATSSHFFKLAKSLSTIPPTPQTDYDVDPLDNSNIMAADPLGSTHFPGSAGNVAQPDLESPGMFRRLSSSLFAPASKEDPEIVIQECAPDMPGGLPKDVDEGINSYSSSLDTISNFSDDKISPSYCKDTYSRTMFRRLSAALAAQNQQAQQVAAV